MNVASRLATSTFLGAVLLLGGGCRQVWKFAPAEIPRPKPAAAHRDSLSGKLPYGRASEVDHAGPAADSGPLSADRPPQTVYEVVRLPDPRLVRTISFDSGERSADAAPWTGPSLDTLLERSSDPMESETHFSTGGVPGFPTRFQSVAGQLCRDVCSDHCNYYSWPTLRDLTLAVAGTSVPANTAMDGNFQNWYQDDVRSSGTDNFAEFWKTLGEGEIFIPAFAGLGLIGNLYAHRPLLGTAGDFGDRVTRGYLVGGPPMLLMQFTLGGSRPGETSVGSQWKPFDDTNAVSGHAFMGAVPFITAARMTDRPLLKAGFYVCSTFTAWSRVNDNDHYLSQICLGWWMAYLACRAVDETELANRHFALVPVASPEFSGLAMVFER